MFLMVRKKMVAILVTTNAIVISVIGVLWTAYTGLSSELKRHIEREIVELICIEPFCPACTPKLSVSAVLIEPIWYDKAISVDYSSKKYPNEYGQIKDFFLIYGENGAKIEGIRTDDIVRKNTTLETIPNRDRDVVGVFIEMDLGTWERPRDAWAQGNLELEEYIGTGTAKLIDIARFGAHAMPGWFNAKKIAMLEISSYADGRKWSLEPKEVLDLEGCDIRFHFDQDDHMNILYVEAVE